MLFDSKMLERAFADPSKSEFSGWQQRSREIKNILVQMEKSGFDDLPVAEQTALAMQAALEVLEEYRR